MPTATSAHCRSIGIRHEGVEERIAEGVEGVAWVEGLRRRHWRCRGRACTGQKRLHLLAAVRALLQVLPAAVEPPLQVLHLRLDCGCTLVGVTREVRGRKELGPGASTNGASSSRFLRDGQRSRRERCLLQCPSAAFAAGGSAVKQRPHAVLRQLHVPEASQGIKGGPSNMPCSGWRWPCLGGGCVKQLKSWRCLPEACIREEGGLVDALRETSEGTWHVQKHEQRSRKRGFHAA
mmetsp:Transcript_42092/g.78216  ORF Transcript_42092/g.78216 Transcript_42092/m.78216 type:complete len:235 (+) Transcript_42092:563-1267(+)